MGDPLRAVADGLSRAGTALVVCGPFGGGAALADHIARACDAGCSLGAQDHVHRYSGLEVHDEVAGTGVGPLPAATSATAGGDVPVIRMVRDRPADGGGSLDLLDPETAATVVAALLGDRIGPERARVVAATLGGATALLDDLPASVLGGADTTGLVRAALELEAVAAALRDMESHGGRSLFELGRVLCLCRPPRLAPTSDWPLLARLMSGAALGPSDLAAALQRFPGLFSHASDDPGAVVPAGPLCRALLLGSVQPSREEHRQLLEALRAVAHEAAPDLPGDATRRQLPEQALLAGALVRLVADPTAVLASDPHALAHAIEQSPEALDDPIARATLLSVHHLEENEDAAAHLELAMRRRGLRAAADVVAAAPAARRWRPLWARSRPASVHRVLIERSVGALCIDAIAERDEVLTFAGYADGAAWRASNQRPAERLTAPSDHELRAVACARLGDELVVAYGASDGHVLAFDGATSAVRWLDKRSHAQPLSAMAAIVAGDRLLVVSAGVQGRVVVHDALTADGAPAVVREEASEVRGLAARAEGGRTLLATACVDGTAAVCDLDTGEVLWQKQLDHGVLNGIAFIADGRTVAAASSAGAVLIAPLDGRPPSTLVTHRSRLGGAAVSANGVRAVPGGVASAGSDGTVFFATGDGKPESWTVRPLVGHVAPAWSVAQARDREGQYLVSTGADGATRLWRPTPGHRSGASSAAASHDEGVDAVALAHDATGAPILLAGDSSGLVRRTRLAPDTEDPVGEPLCQHNDRVSALAVTGENHGEAGLLLASGAIDGTLRLTDLAEHGHSRVLGIVHGGVTSLATGGPSGVPPTLVSGGVDGSIAAWNVNRETVVATFDVCTFGGVTALAGLMLGTERLVAVGGQDGTVRLFRCPNLEPVASLPLDGPVTAVCTVPSAGSRALAVALADGRMVVLQVSRDGRTITRRATISLFHNEILGIAGTIISGRPWIIVCGLDRGLRITEPWSGDLAMQISTDGYGRTITAHRRTIALGTSLGATVLEISPDAL
jgi:WD40 repeat protein